MKYRLIYIVLLIILSRPFGNKLEAQQYFRISGEMTIKSKSASGEQAITIGSVYFDRNVKQIIYHITFPELETWITTDSITYRIISDSIEAQRISIGMAEFSVFNLALNSHLPNFGLKNSSYKIETVEREADIVITTWTPPEHMKEEMGNILVSTKDKELFGVIFMDASGKVLRKQFFEEYVHISGLAFPGRIVEIAYQFGVESYQISTFRNLKLDELENSSKYNFVLPVGSGI